MNVSANYACIPALPDLAEKLREVGETGYAIDVPLLCVLGLPLGGQGVRRFHADGPSPSVFLHDLARWLFSTMGKCTRGAVYAPTRTRVMPLHTRELVTRCAQ